MIIGEDFLYQQGLSRSLAAGFRSFASQLPKDNLGTSGLRYGALPPIPKNLTPPRLVYANLHLGYIYLVDV